MEQLPTRLDGPILIKPDVRGDERGFFHETYRRSAYADLGIFDVVVDVRRGSPAFGQWEAFVLDDEALHQVYCPDGFAHGFCVTSDVADLVYKTSAYYNPALEGGFAYNDPDVAIEWPAGLELIASTRDLDAPLLKEIEPDLPFSYT